MKKINKISNISLIFILIVMFLWSEAGYALRPPLFFSVPNNGKNGDVSKGLAELLPAASQATEAGKYIYEFICYAWAVILSADEMDKKVLEVNLNHLKAIYDDLRESIDEKELILCKKILGELESFSGTQADNLMPYREAFNSADNVAYIDIYYRKSVLLGESMQYKDNKEYGAFAASDTFVIMSISGLFLTKGDEQVLDLGSGNAKAVNLFSQKAGHVTGIEADDEVFEEGLRCIEDLAGAGRVDRRKITLINSDFFEEDFSKYNLIYIYWPFDNPKKRKIEEGVRARLEEKLLKEMKPGSILVVCMPGMGSKELFPGLKRVEVDEDLVPLNVRIYSSIEPENKAAQAFRNLTWSEKMMNNAEDFFVPDTDSLELRQTILHDMGQSSAGISVIFYDDKAHSEDFNKAKESLFLYIGKLFEILKDYNNVNWESDFKNTFNKFMNNFNGDAVKILCKEMDEGRSNDLKNIIAEKRFFYESFVGNDPIKDVDLENLFKIIKRKTNSSYVIFNFKSQETAKHIIGKEGEIYRAFLNLVRNGAEALERKRAEISYPKAFDFKGYIDINVYSDKEYSVIKISDNGPGMPEEALEAFKNRTVYSSKGESGGRGIKAARNIIERNNGTIDVQSELGKGTTFTITLPVAKPSQTLGEKLTHNAPSADL